MLTSVFVVAKQRSGTNLLRRTLATSGLFDDKAEVFHSSGDNRYWGYRTNLISEQPSLSFPSSENQIKIFNLFLEYINKTSSSCSLIDVKYNSTHNLNPVWHDPTAIPFLFRVLNERNIPVIHLLRENILESYISEIVAQKLNIWITNKEHTTQDTKIKIDTHKMISELKYRQREIETFRTWFSELSTLRTLELKYESLIDENSKFSQEVSDKICDFLGVDDTLSLSIPTKKITKSLPDLVVNYHNEVVPALYQSGYGNFVNDMEVSSKK